MTLLRIGYAPLVFVGFIGAALYASDGGRYPPALGPLLLAGIVVSLLAERVAPYQPAFNRPKGDVGRDVLHAIVNEAANGLAVLSMPLLAATRPAGGAWPAHWPAWAQLALAVVIADCGITLAHYASHRSRLLWRFHSVHHSVERLYALNGLMKHPLHQAFELAAGTLPLVVLGMPQPTAWLLAFAVAIQLLLQHANVDVRLGPASVVWAVAPAHRSHHLADPVAGDVNFGLFTCLWDHLLGTFVPDRARRFAPGDFGIAGRPDYPRAYLRQLAEPFRPA